MANIPKSQAQVAVRNGRCITPQGMIENGTVLVKAGRIETVRAAIPTEELQGYEQIDAGGGYVVPGFIDGHMQGGVGYDFLTASPAEMEALLAWLPSVGTTGLLATLTTASGEDMIAAIERVRAVMDRNPAGSRILGIHLEGPYVHPEKVGAQSTALVRLPDVEEARRFVRAARGAIRLMTLAPEQPGALELIRYLVSEGIVISAGHCTSSFDDMERAVEAGLTRVTHLYNTMPDLSARNPGVIGATLAREDLYAEIILDGVHVHPALVKATLRAKGTGRVLLVTDATQATGLPDGNYVRPGNLHIVVKNGIARSAEGRLAGSTLTLHRAFVNAVNLLGLSVQDASQIASGTPAASLGLQDRVGSLAPGMDADVVVLGPDLSIQCTLVEGQVRYRADR